jgi:hypothetical protein
MKHSRGPTSDVDKENLFRSVELGRGQVNYEGLEQSTFQSTYRGPEARKRLLSLGYKRLEFTQ